MASEEDHACPDCQKSFTRLEHLKRHKQTHSERQFRCGQCDKTFFRKDALQRHSITHRQPASLVQKGGRACVECALAKARCSGQVPACARCTTKKVACRYPVLARQSRQSVSRGGRDEVSAMPPPPLPEDSPAVAGGSQSPSVVQMEQSFDVHGGPSGFDAVSCDLQDQNLLRDQPVDGQSYPQPEPRSIRDLDMYASGFAAVPVDGNGDGDGDGTGNGTTTDLQSFGMFDLNQWSPNILSNINWLPTQTVNLDYADFSMPFDMAAPTNAALSATGATQNYMHNRVSPTANWQAMQNVDRTAFASQSPVVSQNSPTTTTTTSALTSAHLDTPISTGGEYYVDGEGDGSRLAKSKRRKIIPSSTAAVDVRNVFSLVCPQTLSSADPAIDLIGDPRYEQMRQCYSKLSSGAGIFQPYSHAEFPTKHAFNQLLKNYIDIVSPTISFIHHSALMQQTSPTYCLLLAAAALGSQFVEGEDADLFSYSLHELVRRMILALEAGSSGRGENTRIELMQIRLLHAVGGFHSGNGLHRQSAFRALSDAARDAQSMILSSNKDNVRDSPDQWQEWIKEETLLRSTFFIWFLDSIVTVQMKERGKLDLQTAAAWALPCHESLWEAEDQSTWHKLRLKHTHSPTLLRGLQSLYMEKRLPTEIGEYSRILLIYAIIQRTKEVRGYFSQGISHIEPAARKHLTSELALNLPIWHQSMSLFNQWRNLACDCLDILHWSANAAIGAASGVEHPTVLHLHFSRVALLAPTDDIVRLAGHLTGIDLRDWYGSTGMSSSEASGLKYSIRAWTVQDQYKARLAAIHAGVSFWHLRRFSANGFYEPSALSLSALVLWALSAFQVKTPQSSTSGMNGNQLPTALNVGVNSTHVVPPDMCDIILLDRPTDDELVQQFVRQGASMRANMTGVGDLFGPHGPQRVLAKAQKLLRTLGAWRIAQKWLNLLQQLEKVTAKEDFS